MSRTYKETADVNLTIPWDKLVARGFIVSLIVHGLLLLLLPMMKVEVKEYDEVKTIPIELINFGLGDGTGKSAGNLTEKGKTAKGREVKDPLADASLATKTKSPSTAVNTDPTQSNSLTPVKELPSDGQTADNKPNSGSESIGKKNGELGGTGLGESGLGKGRGLGLGDIEWGGGGNRTVVNKVLPKFPPGAQASRVRLKFWVSAEGFVTKVVPLQKGDPRVERAAIDALYRWKFNPLKSDVEMAGIIPFDFQLQ